MSVDNRSKRGGSKNVRKGGGSTRTGRTPVRGDARSHPTDDYRSRSGSRGRRTMRSRSPSARSHRHRSARSGDVRRDGASGGDPTAWDSRSYLSMDQTQNLNMVAQPGGRMNVSEYDTNSSPPSLFSESSWGSRCSSPTRSEEPYPPPTGSNRRPQSRHRHRRQSSLPPEIIQGMSEQPSPPLIGKAQSPLWVILRQGINTRGGRVCWMPAEFQTKFDGQTYQVTARELKRFMDKGYELRPATNQEWLQKGIRLEQVVLHRKENHGPAAQLVVFRDHPHMGGAPFHTNHPGPTHIGKVEVRKIC